MNNNLSDRMPDDGGRGPVRSPGQRLQTGKYTYRPTEIQGKRHTFMLRYPLKLTMEKIADDYVVTCEELEMYCCIIGDTKEEALKMFARCFEESYESYVEDTDVATTDWTRLKFEKVIAEVIER